MAETDRWSKLLSQQQMGKHVDEIVRQYEGLTKSQRQAGQTWYEKAYDIAHEIGKGDVKKGAGIISALSPMTEWNLNVHKARELARTGKTTSVGGLQNVRKAQRILAGEDPDTLFDFKTGPKTLNFYQNIADPSNPHAVTIDRHAYDAANNRAGAIADLDGKIKGGRYTHFSDAYKNATHRIGGSLVPQQVQASVWVGWREGKGL